MRYLLFCLMLALISLPACTSTKVERVDVDQIIDLSGEWNDYDASLVSKEMVADSLNGRWLTVFETQYNRKPTVIVGHVVNRTDEHINTYVFTEYLERELLNSGKIIFVASAQEREELRDERDDQQHGYTDPATMAALGKERGANFMLIGSVNTIKDEVRGKAVNYYQVNLELVDLSTNEKVWIGREEIKKYVRIKKYSL